MTTSGIDWDRLLACKHKNVFQDIDWNGYTCRDCNTTISDDVAFRCQGIFTSSTTIQDQFKLIILLRRAERV